MAELVKDLVLVSLGMGIGVVLMCIAQVSKMADEEMEEIKKNLLNSELQGLMDKRKELLSEKDKSKATLNSLKNEKRILEEKILK